jgi:hypothetical protein
MNGVLHLSDGQQIKVAGQQAAALREALGSTANPVEFLAVVDVHGVHHKVKADCVVSLEYRQTQYYRGTEYSETEPGDVRVSPAH